MLNACDHTRSHLLQYVIFLNKVVMLYSTCVTDHCNDKKYPHGAMYGEKCFRWLWILIQGKGNSTRPEKHTERPATWLIMIMA